jgi:hypothetical protein
MLRRTIIRADEQLSKQITARARMAWYERLVPEAFARVTRRESNVLHEELVDGFEQLDVAVTKFRMHAISDGGPFLFLDTAEGKVLFLGGQWLYDPTIVVEVLDEPSDAFWAEFSIVRSPGTGIVFGFKPSTRRLILADRPLHRGIPDMGESCLFQGSCDTLEADLEQVANRPR